MLSQIVSKNIRCSSLKVCRRFKSSNGPKESDMGFDFFFEQFKNASQNKTPNTNSGTTPNTNSGTIPNTRRVTGKYEPGNLRRNADLFVPGNRKKGGNKEGKPRPVRYVHPALAFEFTTGSDTAKKAAKSLIEKILQSNPKGDVIHITESGLVDTNIEGLLPNIDLDSMGFSVVDWKIIDEEKKVAMIKTVPARIALKQFSDEVAGQKQKELEETNMKAKWAAKAQAKAQKKKQSAKFVNVSWNLSMNDLKLQKRKEIVDKIDDNLNFFILLDNANNLKKVIRNSESREKLLKDFNEDEEENIDEEIVEKELISKFERIKREKIFEEIKTILSEHNVTIETEGSIDRKMKIKVSTPQETKAKEDPKKAAVENEVSPKEKKKLERLEKQRIREEKKKAELDEKKKMFEFIVKE